jgi:hypothetical protein
MAYGVRPTATKNFTQKYSKTLNFQRKVAVREKFGKKFGAERTTTEGVMNFEVSAKKLP